MIPTLIVVILLKVLLLALPLAVTLLALRRMVASQSANAWLYGATALYTTVTSLGILPWAIGFAGPPSLFLTLSALSPMVWTSVVMLCDRDRLNRYDNKGLDESRDTPFLLTDPMEPTVPVFRHSKPEPVIHAISLAPARRTGRDRDVIDGKDRSGVRGVLAVAKEMRSGSSARRRDRSPKLLASSGPQPSDLPFLPRMPT